MNRFLLAAAIAATTFSSTTGATDVGVSVSIGQPGFYGRIDIGGYPPPALIYREPVMIQAVPYGRPPLYLRVPPGHAKKWHKYCHRYHACGERVYFVRDDWYEREYAPRYRERHYGHRDHDRHDYRHDDRGDYRDGYRDGRRDEHRRDMRQDWREDRRDDRRHERQEARRERHDDRHDDRGHGRGRGRDD